MRGKIGQLSRTELVGKVLRHESGLRHSDLIADVARLSAAESLAREELAQTEDELAQSVTDLRAMRGASWHLLALDHASEAMVVCQPPGHIIYANLQAQHTFLAEPGELEGSAVWELAVPEDRETRRLTAEAFFRVEEPQRLVVGVERPFHALRRDGASFRAVLVAERFMGPSGPMSVITVREAAHDVEALVGMLRRPFATQ